MSTYGWSEVLGSIEAALAQALAKAVVPPEASNPEHSDAWSDEQAKKLDDRRAARDAILQKAQQAVTEVDEQLAAIEALLRQWRAKA